MFQKYKLSKVNMSKMNSVNDQNLNMSKRSAENSKIENENSTNGHINKINKSFQINQLL